MYNVPGLQGKNLETLRKFLGHSDITTTARYLHVDHNEVTIAASETLAELMDGEIKATDEATKGII